MGKLKTWFNKLTKPQQVAVLVAILGFLGLVLSAILTGVFSIAVAKINNSEPPAPSQPHFRNPEVERLNAEISDFLKTIDNTTESDTNQN